MLRVSKLASGIGGAFHRRKFIRCRNSYYQSHWISQVAAYPPQASHSMEQNALLRLRILYGSQSGTAEAYASDLEFEAEDIAGLEVELVNCSDVSPKQLVCSGTRAETGAGVICTSSIPTVNVLVLACYGDGEPTDNAKEFYSGLMDDKLVSSLDFSGCMFAVFGLGDSASFADHYNVVGPAVSSRLTALGARSLMPLGLGDASNDSFTTFSQWKEELLVELSHLLEQQKQKAGINGGCSREYRSGNGANHAASSSKPTPTHISTSAPGLPLISVAPAPPTAMTANSSTEPVRIEPASGADTDTTVVPASNVSSDVPPLRLSARQLAMAPPGRPILLAPVRAVRQELLHSDEINSMVSVQLDLRSAALLSPAKQTSGIASGTAGSARNGSGDSGGGGRTSLTVGLQAGDHVGVFAPNSRGAVHRFAASAGLTARDLQRPAVSIPGLLVCKARVPPSPAPALEGEGEEGENKSEGEGGEKREVTLEQVLTWQVQLTGTVPLTCLKLLLRWAASVNSGTAGGEGRGGGLQATVAHLRSLVTHYDSHVLQGLPGLDISSVLNMLPEQYIWGLAIATTSAAGGSGGGSGGIPLGPLLRALPAIAPRLYSLTNDPQAASGATHATLLCRLLRYRQLEPQALVQQDRGSWPAAASAASEVPVPPLSYSQRLVSGLCSSYLGERLLHHHPLPYSAALPVDPQTHPGAQHQQHQQKGGEQEEQGEQVAFFFRESNFHLPTDPRVPVVMIAGGSGIAPFLSFLEARARQLNTSATTTSDTSKEQQEQQQALLGPAVLYFGCRSPAEFAFRDQLTSYLPRTATTAVHAPALAGEGGGEGRGEEGLGLTAQSPLSRLVVSYSSPDAIQQQQQQHEEEEKEEEGGTGQDQRGSGAVVWPRAENITDVVATAEERRLLLPLLQRGAHVYVCGGASQFGRAVRRVVNDLALHVTTHTAASAAASSATGAEVIALSVDPNLSSSSIRDTGDANASAAAVTLDAGVRELVRQKRYFEDLAD